MPRTSTSDLDPVLRDLLADMVGDRTVLPQEVIAAHPEHATALQTFLANHSWFTDLTLPVRTAIRLRTNHGPAIMGRHNPGERKPPVGADMPPTDVVAPPEYKLLDFLGGGGMGVVFSARHYTLDRKDALKFIRSGSWATQEERDHFLREARAAAKVEHENVVRVYSAGSHAGFDYCALEFVAGGSLAERLIGQPWPPADAAAFIAKVARGLDAVHEQGLIHRDIKPGNILLGSSRDSTSAIHNPKLADFGLAKPAYGAHLNGQITGTPAYMSPEQASGGKVGPASDIFSLGVVLYQLLTGQIPFNGNSVHSILKQICSAEPQPPRTLNAAVPVALETVCMRCLAKKPAERFKSAQDLAGALEDIGRVNKPRLPETAAWRSPFISRWQLWTGIAVVGILLLGTGIWWTLTHVHNADNVNASSADDTSSSTVAVALRVKSFEITHFPRVGDKASPARHLGKDSFNAHLNDQVTLSARLSRPGYVYMLAFPPDAAPELCFPDKENQAPPLTDTPRYPISSAREMAYGLSEGTGLWVFVLIVSEEPLLSFNDWKAGHTLPALKKQQSPPNTVWFDDGEWVEAMTPKGLERCDRAKGAEMPGKSAVVRVTDALKKDTGAAAVSAIGFAVLPRE